jgi:hypothetical protein
MKRDPEDTRLNGPVRLCSHERERERERLTDIHIYTSVYIHDIYWFRGGVQLPSFLSSVGPSCVSFPYTCGLRGAIKLDSCQFSTGSCWIELLIEPCCYPDYAEWARAVLAREGDSTSLGPGVLFWETVTVT